MDEQDERPLQDTEQRRRENTKVMKVALFKMRGFLDSKVITASSFDLENYVRISDWADVEFFLSEPEVIARRQEDGYRSELDKLAAERTKIETRMEKLRSVA